jgi:hypothetical protein
MVAPICPTICSPGGGAGGGVYSATKITNSVPFAAPSILSPDTVVPFDTVVFDVGPAITPDLPSLVINQDGFYEIIATHTWTGVTGSNNVISIMVNDVVVQSDSAENPGTRAGSLSVLLQLSAGDVVQLRASSDGPGGDLLTATLSAEKRN